jgi:hypothetical protein
MTPLPVHANHPDQGTGRLERFSQHGACRKGHAHQAASYLVVDRWNRSFETIAGHRTTLSWRDVGLILCLNGLKVNGEKYLNAQNIAPANCFTRAPRRYNRPMPTSRDDLHPLTVEQTVQLRRDLLLVEERLRDIAILMRVCYGEESQAVIRADETAASLQRLKWELERTKVQTAGG